MRVLHLYAGNLYGGVETFLVALARHRAAGAPLEPHFALAFPGRLRDELAAAGVPVHDLGPARVRRPWTVWRARRRLRDLLRRGRYGAAVCHSCWPHALFAPVVRSCGVPLVFWAHDAVSGVHWLERWARRTPPDLVLANSRFTHASVSGLFPGVPVEVLYLPVSPPKVGDRRTVRAAVRSELATPPDAVVIVTACRLERLKGHALLLDALSRL